MRVGRLVSWETDLANGTRMWTPEAAALFGLDGSRLSGCVGGDGDELRHTIHPDDRHLLGQYHAGFETLDQIDVAYRIVRPDGGIRHLAGRGEVVSRDASGRPRLVNVVADVTSRVQAEEQVRQSTLALAHAKARFEALVKASAQIVWATRPDGQIQEDSPSWRAFTGQSYAQWRGHGWLDAVHPEDRRAAIEAWSEAIMRQEIYEVDYRLLHVSGEYRWVTARAVPLRADDGSVSEWVGLNEDISERKQRENDLRLVMRELSHRTKNLLAVIQSIARRSFDANGKAEPRVDAFLDRLHGLAVSHDLLVGGNWVGATLKALVDAHLRPFRCAEAAVAIEGPAVLLKPDAAQNIGIGLHELATNAAKYGALSDEGGRLDIAWSIDTSAGWPVLEFEWREATTAQGPRSRRGFGTLLLDTIVPRAAGGGAVLRIDRNGVFWRLSAPLEALV